MIKTEFQINDAVTPDMRRTIERLERPEADWGQPQK